MMPLNLFIYIVWMLGEKGMDLLADFQANLSWHQLKVPQNYAKQISCILKKKNVNYQNID